MMNRFRVGATVTLCLAAVTVACSEQPVQSAASSASGVATRLENVTKKGLQAAADSAEKGASAAADAADRLARKVGLPTADAASGAAAQPAR